MKILVLGETPNLNSGFSIVLRRLNKYFLELGHEIEMIGWGQLKPSEKDWGYKIHSTNFPNGGYYGQEIFDKIVMDFSPDIVFSLGDVYAMEWIPKTQTRDDFVWIPYVTIDSQPIPKSWRNTLRNADLLAVCSKFAMNVVQQQIPEIANKTRMLYYGIDTNLFYPVDKTTVRKENNLDTDIFMLLYVGVNSERKQVPRLIEAFDIFSKNKDDVFLYLHTPLIQNGGREGWFLKNIFEQYGLTNKILMSQNAGPENGIQEEAMPILYNSSDVFVSPSSCEGFGLPFIEAAACKVSSIGINYSSIPELVDGHGELVPASDWIHQTPYGMKRPLISIKKLAKKMDKLYRNRQLLKEYSNKAYEFSQGFDWSNRLPEFGALIDEAYEMTNQNKKDIYDIKAMVV